MDIPFSQACENNKVPILSVFKIYQVEGDILEIGHGTGQHAIYMAENLNCQWYASDVAENLWMLAGRKVLPSNLHHSIELQVGKATLFKQLNQKFDHVFTANTLHIMSERHVDYFCEEVHELLNVGGKLFIYGPFKFKGEFTSESNKSFDQSLRERDQNSGIRDFENIRNQMRVLNLIKIIDMPANNNILVFEK